VVPGNQTKVGTIFTRDVKKITNSKKNCEKFLMGKEDKNFKKQE
jgi:hypothetical protein